MKTDYILCACLSVLCAFILPSCTAQVEQTIRTEAVSRRVTFNLPDLWVMRQEPLSRANLSDSRCTRLYVLVDGRLTDTQLNTDPDFGSPVLDLDYGTRNIRFVASQAELQFDAQGTFSAQADESVGETLAKSVSLEVTKETPAQTVTLERIISCLEVQVSDAIRENTHQARLTAQCLYRTFALNTFFSSTSTSASKTWTIPTSKVGVIGASFVLYTYCPSLTKEWLTDARIEFLDTDGNAVAAHDLKDVSLRANRKTICNGRMYGDNRDFQIVINGEWDNELVYEF